MIDRCGSVHYRQTKFDENIYCQVSIFLSKTVLGDLLIHSFMFSYLFKYFKHFIKSVLIVFQIIYDVMKTHHHEQCTFRALERLSGNLYSI